MTHVIIQANIRPGQQNHFILFGNKTSESMNTLAGHPAGRDSYLSLPKDPPHTVHPVNLADPATEVLFKNKIGNSVTKDRLANI